MKERKTVKDLKEFLESLDPKFDNASLGVVFSSDERIVDYDIVVSIGTVISPTKDKERQAALVFGGRNMMEKVEENYKKHKEKDNNTKED